MQRPFLILLFLLIGCPKLSASWNYFAGARATALSNAFVSHPDTWSTFHNQATLIHLKTFSTGIFFESKYMIDELSLAAGSVVLPARTGTFGLSFYQFGKESYKLHKVGLAFAKQLSHRLSAGLQLDYFRQQFPENDAPYGFATFEGGVTYMPAKQLWLGAHINNPIRNGISLPEGKQKMPACYRIGGHCQLSQLLSLSLETQFTSGYTTMVKSGLEFSPANNLALRFGVSGKPVQCSAGLGYTIKKLTTDIAFSYHGNLGITPSISLSVKL